MSRLKEYRFADLYYISSGISSKPEQAGHGFPFVSFSTIFNNHFLPDVLSDKMDTSPQEQETYSVKKRDILLTRTSETVDELAMSCVADKDYPQATFSGFAKRLRPKTSGIAHHRYLAFYLRGKYFRQSINNHSLMTLRASFNEEIFKLLLLYLPEYEQQKSIGDFLYSIQEKIKVNNAINAELERLAKAIYEYWFVQFDFPNAEGKPYKSSGGAMTCSPTLKCEIPTGWRLDMLQDKLSLERGVEPGSEAYLETLEEGYTPFIRVSDMGVIPALNIPSNITAGKECKLDDVLVSFDGSVGRVAIAMSGAYSSGIRKIKAKDKDYTDALIYFIFQSEYIQKTIAKYATGSNILHAASSIEHLAFPYDETVVKSYMERVEPMFRQIITNKIQNRELAKIRDFLLPLLMNGQVTILDKGGAA
jgi:type I restriction enzyme S subunit